MKIALCNEVLAPLDFARQCALARVLGYDGLELAPFTFGDEPHLMGAAQRAEIRAAAAAEGIAITGLHWLLVTPKGLSITTPDAALRARTIDVLRRLIELCADLGGSVLVHGSHHQRAVAAGETVETARGRAAETWAAIAPDAAKAGVVHCIEPLAPEQTQVINTVAEAAEIVRAVGSPGLRTMIDTCAASLSEAEPVAEVIARWLPTGVIGHIQVNDRNRHGPGQGDDRFAPVFRAILDAGYDKVVAAEPFIYVPDGVGCAARTIGYIRGILEGIGAGR